MQQVLYRKYRPRFFRDVAGQENITSVLSKEVEEGTFSHAYLFTGSRGIGKTTCAKILAKAVNCPNEKDGEPCGECNICKGIDDGSLLDVTEMDAASNRNIDDIRDIKSEANFTPAVAKYRIYIIDEAHMLTKEAANALLKILEEPPEHVIFILATTEINKLPVTILSRCMRFDFRRMSPEVIGERLKFVCKNEHIDIEDDAAQLIGKLADGGMRDALSLLDICRSNDGIITTETVFRCAGMIGHEYIYDICDMIANKDTSSVLTKIDDVYNESADVSRICDELINHYRDLMIVSCSKDAQSILKIMPGEYSRLSKQVEKISKTDIFYSLSVLQDTMVKMSKSASKRLEFEMALLKLCVPEAASTSEALTARIEALEAEVKALKMKAVSVPSEKPNIDIPVQNDKVIKETVPIIDEKPLTLEKNISPVKPESDENAKPFPQWDDVVEVLRGTCPMIYPFLTNSRAVISGGRILIDADNVMFFEFMRSNSDAGEMVKKAITEVCGVRYGIGPYKRNEKQSTDGNAVLAGIADRAKEMGIEVEME